VLWSAQDVAKTLRYESSTAGLNQGQRLSLVVANDDVAVIEADPVLRMALFDHGPATSSIPSASIAAL
jgi:ethanolamine utilization microcompartment shell protein EutL